MSTVTSNLFRLFRGHNEAATAHPALPDRIMRRSTALTEFNRTLASKEPLCVLDLGPTSPRNIAYLTDLGHKLYNEDVLTAANDPALKYLEDGVPKLNVARFLDENLKFSGTLFDAVFCWDVPDYLPEPLVKPLVERLAEVTKPGAVLLAFFHSREAGADIPYYRYHITGKDSVELQRGSSHKLQRVFQNRHVENLFKDFASLKFFLARDHVREVLVVR